MKHILYIDYFYHLSTYNIFCSLIAELRLETFYFQVD